MDIERTPDGVRVFREVCPGVQEVFEISDAEVERILALRDSPMDRWLQQQGEFGI